MAVMSTTVEWKQAAMQRAERLTDIWDIVKAWAGRAAEIVLTVCMFAQLIGMLPGVNYPMFVNNTILGVQIVMLDFGAFALAPLIEHARQIGQEQAAQKAEDMATFLVRLVILTVVLIIIGQFAPIFGAYAWLVTAIVKYSEPVLILVRVGCVVKYIHVIHSLRSTTALAVQPTAQPAQPLDYQEIARQLLPTLRDELKQISGDVTQELHGEIALLTEQVVNLQAVQITAQREPVDEPGQENIVNLQSYREVHNDEPSDEPETRPTPRITVNLQAAKRETKREPAKGSGTAQEKAARILKRTPEITASELAKRAGCTPQYAGRLLKRQSVN